MEYLPGKRVDLCVEVWFGPWRIIYGMLSILLHFLLPFLCSLYVYCNILSYFTQKRNSQFSRSQVVARRLAERARQRHTSMALLVMLLLFLACWAPIHLLNIIEDFGVPVHCWPYYYFTFFLAHLLAMTSTCTNPILYGRINGFRENLPHLVKSLTQRRRLARQERETSTMFSVPTTGQFHPSTSINPAIPPNSAPVNLSNPSNMLATSTSNMLVPSTTSLPDNNLTTTPILSNHNS